MLEIPGVRPRFEEVGYGWPSGIVAVNGLHAGHAAEEYKVEGWLPSDPFSRHTRSQTHNRAPYMYGHIRIGSRNPLSIRPPHWQTFSFSFTGPLWSETPCENNKSLPQCVK